MERVFSGGDIDSFHSAIRTATETGGELQIEPGTYRFDVHPSSSGQPPRHAEFTGIDDLTVNGNGATIVFTEPMSGGFWFEGGSEITFRDLTFDYDPVPFTQGVIEAVSSADQTATITLDTGYPTLDHEMFQRADTVYALSHNADGSFVQGLRANGATEKYFSTIDTIENRTYRLTLHNGSDLRGISAGSRLTIVARNNTTTLSFYKTSNPTLKNITVRASSGGAFATQVCRRPSFHNCTIARPASSNRQLSTVADGIRITNCLENSTIANCRHEQLGDDSIAIDHRMAEITSIVSERTVEVESLHPFVVKAGDTLEGLSPSGIRKRGLPPVESITERSTGIGERQKPRTITFTEPVTSSLTKGDYLGNTETDSKNYTVRNNELRNNRANNIRASTGPGLIEGNRLDGAHLRAIELHTGTRGDWPAKGGITDVTVRDNTIRRSGLALLAGPRPSAVLVHHETPPGEVTKGQPNEHVEIEGNDIETCAAAGIDIEATTDVTITENLLRDLNRLDYPNSGYGVLLSNVSNGAVTGNDVAGTSEALSGFGLRSASTGIATSDNEFTVEGAAHPAELRQLVPVTFEFSRTVRAEEGGRPLAFLCYELAIVDESGTVIQAASLGSDEDGVSFGTGIDGREQSSSKSWRWFGPENTRSVVYFFASDLAKSTTLRLRGYPIESGISATVRVGGEQTDEITWQTTETQTYRLSLDN